MLTHEPMPDLASAAQREELPPSPAGRHETEPGLWSDVPGPAQTPGTWLIEADGGDQCQLRLTEWGSAKASEGASGAVPAEELLRNVTAHLKKGALSRTPCGRHWRRPAHSESVGTPGWACGHGTGVPLLQGRESGKECSPHGSGASASLPRARIQGEWGMDAIWLGSAAQLPGSSIGAPETAFLETSSRARGSRTPRRSLDSSRTAMHVGPRSLVPLDGVSARPTCNNIMPHDGSSRWDTAGRTGSRLPSVHIGTPPGRHANGQWPAAADAAELGRVIRQCYQPAADKHTPPAGMLQLATADICGTASCERDHGELLIDSPPSYIPRTGERSASTQACVEERIKVQHRSACSRPGSIHFGTALEDEEDVTATRSHSLRSSQVRRQLSKTLSLGVPHKSSLKSPNSGSPCCRPKHVHFNEVVKVRKFKPSA